jgi:hypothetical protein
MHRPKRRLARFLTVFDLNDLPTLLAKSFQVPLFVGKASVAKHLKFAICFVRTALFEQVVECVFGSDASLSRLAPITLTTQMPSLHPHGEVAIQKQGQVARGESSGIAIQKHGIPPEGRQPA